MRALVMKSIRWYQKFISRVFLAGLTAGCRFSPSCSLYTYQSVAKYGTIKGLFLGVIRILKCHPFSKGGTDPVR